MKTLFQDVRYGARLLVKQPGFTAVVGLTLALAIGANTLIFSIVSFMLLRPLPLKNIDTLAAIFAVDPQRGDDRARVSYQDLLDWRDRTQSFASLAAMTSGTYTLSGRGEPLRVEAQRVSWNLLDVWGFRLELGRNFRAGEDAPGAGGAVILSDGFWRRQFAADPGIVGQAITLNGEPYTVIGVLDPEAELGNLSLIDVWTPLALAPDTPRDTRNLRVYGRLKPGATVDQASVEVGTVARQLQQEHPLTNTGWNARVVPALVAMTGANTWLVLSMLGVFVSLVLVIACANVANLMLARSVARRRELALRAALGAGRMRIVRQILTESVLLGLLGGLVGLAIAKGGLLIMQAVAYEPFFAQIVLDYRVLTFAAALALVTPLLFAFLPALQTSRLDLTDALKEGGRTTGGVRGRRSRNVLVVAQLGLAMTLLVLSGLIIRTAIAEARLHLGFDPANVLTMQVDLTGPRYPDDERARLFYETVVERLERLPGVKTASVVSALPAFGGLGSTDFEIEGRPVPTPADRPWALQVTASPDYFRTFDIPLVQGRLFTRDDGPQAAGIVLVSREAARRYWQDSDPIGRRIRLGAAGTQSPWLTIVGIVADVVNHDDFNEPENPQIYLPVAQHPARAMAIALRTTADPNGLTPEVRSVIHAVDPDQALYDVRTMAQRFHEQLASDRLLYGMFTAFAFVALLLASAGLYGVMSYSVVQRTPEFGVRIALGAQGGEVVRLVVRQGLKLVVVGLVIGLVGGRALAQAVASVLFGVGPGDPLTFAGVTILLATVGLAASYVPARRAVMSDPIQTLRQ
jgi:putative ABC transport system permease protein